MTAQRTSIRLASSLCLILLTASGVSAADPAAPARFDNPRWSPDARKIALASEDRARILIHDLEAKTTIEVASGPSSGYAFNWSPDGSLLAFKLLVPVGEQSPPLQVPALYNVAERKVLPLHPAVPQAGVPSFSDHGQIAFTVGNDLLITDLTGRELQRFNLGNYVNLAAISPDSRLVAYNDADEQIWIIDLAGGARTKLTNGAHSYCHPIWSPDSTKLLVSTISGLLETIDLLTSMTYPLGKGRGASWAADSKTIHFSKMSRVDGVRLLGTELLRTQFDGSGLTANIRQPYAAAQTSPDVTRAAFISAKDGGLYIAPLAVRGQPAAPAADGDALASAERIEVSTEGEKSPIILAAPPNLVTLSRTVPYIHQVYDTPDNFNGHWACGATSAMMCLGYYNVLPYWDVTVSTPYSHVSHYGRYICEIYTYNGYTYNIGSADPNGRLGYGGYGYIVRNNWADTKGYMRDYFNNHLVPSSVDWSPTWAKLKTEINNQHPFVLLNMLTTSGHYITTIGYSNTQHTAVFNDPYGNKNSGYMNYSGAGVYYDWPGYNNGYSNLNEAECFIYARATIGQTFIVESRAGGKNVGKYSETGVWADASNKSTAGGVTPGIGARYGSTYRSVAGEKHALFKADLTQGGSYEVFVTWGTRSDLRTPVLHRISYFGGTADVNVNQTTGANTWVSLGTYAFAAGTNVGQVDVNNLNIDVSGSMLADAVKWEFRSSIAAPSITTQPTARNICPGSNTTFTVVASGPGILLYQWQKNGVPLSNGGHYSGVTTSTLTVSGADAGDVATYRCIVTNAGGSATSSGAGLTLKAATSITQQPTPSTVCPGSGATFTVAGTGDGTLSYQWRKNGANLVNGGHYAGVNTNTLSVSNITSAEAGDYSCVITAGCGSATSQSAALIVKVVVAADFDADCDVDTADVEAFIECTSGPDVAFEPQCGDKDLDGDSDVDMSDFGRLQRCLSGETVSPDPTCGQ